MAIQAMNHARQRGTRRMSSSTGKVRPQASKPLAKLKVLAVAQTTQRMNFQTVAGRSVPVTTRLATRKRPGKNDGNPDAKIHNSYFAGVKIVRTASQKQIAIAPDRRPERRSKMKMPAAVNQQQTTESIIWSRTSQ